jgi:hypothetical protein
VLDKIVLLEDTKVDLAKVDPLKFITTGFFGSRIFVGDIELQLKS